MPAAPTQLLQADLLRALSRFLPADYLAPLKVPGPGYEVLQAFAKLGERLSLAVVRLDAGGNILLAPDPGFATATVSFSRPIPPVGTMPAVTLQAGSIVTTSVGARDFATLTDVAFAANDPGPHTVVVRAIAPGFEWNVPSSTVTLAGETIPGSIDTIKKLAQADPITGLRTFLDGSFTVSQVTDAMGGACAALDQLGADRGLPRAAGESSTAYRLRLRSLPDTVSAGAVTRFLAAAFAPCGLTAAYVETWDSAYQTAWDFPDDFTSAPTDATNLFTYDDPRPAFPPFENRWLDDAELNGAFIAVLPIPQPIYDVGGDWDDDTTSASALVDFVSAQPCAGFRALSAWDFDGSEFVEGVDGVEWCWDGPDLGIESLYAGVWSSLQAIKAAGVAAIVEQQGQ
jgi:hypothetical protein